MTRNPLTGNVSKDRLERELFSGAQVYYKPADSVDGWAHVFIGNEVAIGCRAEDAQRYVNELRQLKETT